MKTLLHEHFRATVHYVITLWYLIYLLTKYLIYTITFNFCFFVLACIGHVNFSVQKAAAISTYLFMSANCCENVFYGEFMLHNWILNTTQFFHSPLKYSDKFEWNKWLFHCHKNAWKWLSEGQMYNRFSACPRRYLHQATLKHCIWKTRHFQLVCGVICANQMKGPPISLPTSRLRLSHSCTTPRIRRAILTLQNSSNPQNYVVS